MAVCTTTEGDSVMDIHLIPKCERIANAWTRGSKEDTNIGQPHSKGVGPIKHIAARGLGSIETVTKRMDIMAPRLQATRGLLPVTMVHNDRWK